MMVLGTFYLYGLMYAPDLSGRLREHAHADLVHFWQSLSTSQVLKAAKHPRNCGDDYPVGVAMPLTWCLRAL